MAADNDAALTNKEIMAKINGGKGLFNAVKKGLNGSKQDWTVLAKNCKEISAMADTMASNKPRKGPQASWDKLAATYAKNARTLAEATEKMDLAAAKKAQQAMGSSCTGCHRMHK
jgi:hypothetical protein